MNDPLAVMWDALERGGWGPNGQEWDFYASCPAHEGDGGRSLGVSEGVDGRALVTCYRGCATADVLATLGLRWRDLFPGTRSGFRWPVKKRLTVDAILAALRRHNIGYAQSALDFWVAVWCPACRMERLWIEQTGLSDRLAFALRDSAREVFDDPTLGESIDPIRSRGIAFSCHGNGCTVGRILDALELAA